MQILLSPAKDMAGDFHCPSDPTEPLFQKRAGEIAAAMAAYSPDEIAGMLKCGRAIAAGAATMYKAFFAGADGLPAWGAYNGIAFKHLGAETMDAEDSAFAQGRLWIASPLYGLLRPLDGIRPHRMEAWVRLPGNGGRTMADYWKPLLTPLLTAACKDDGGLLLNVASKEMTGLFRWADVEREVEVVEPQFLVQEGGRVKTVTVYAKMCRGAMARYAIKERIATPSGLEGFTHEGFRYSPEHSSPLRPAFVKRA